MTIEHWNPVENISLQEQYLLERCKKKRKLFFFLRVNRLKIFDDDFQNELDKMYRDTGAGKTKIYPAFMAMALIMQGYLGLSDADAVEMTVVDLRWQMVLDRIGSEVAAFSQGALFDFRNRLIEHNMDRRLLEKTAELARRTKGFDSKRIPKSLRIAIDSSPIEGAGRVEDTINLIGHAARKVVKCISQLIDSTYEEICIKAGIPLLLDKSVKKALDRDWSDPVQKVAAVDILAKQVLSLERWITNHLASELKEPSLQNVLSVLRQLMDQDIEPDPDGSSFLIKKGVAKNRRISVEDGEMSHGRKSKSKLINGYKRHIATDLDSKTILAYAITPTNIPEYIAFSDINNDLELQNISFSEAHFDRGYIGSDEVKKLLSQGTEILCKPWRIQNGGLFTKEDFVLDLDAMEVTCPAGNTKEILFGKVVRFSSIKCKSCSMRGQCTKSKEGRGRSIRISENERLQEGLREMAKTIEGRNNFRERVGVEHALAHISQRQGNKARYIGIRKNLYDLRRVSSIQNMETAQQKAA